MSDIQSLRRILRTSKTIAMVGLSANWYRPSFFAAKYLQDHGYRVIPVTPQYDEVLGEKCYPTLQDVPEPVDVVDCFRRVEEIPALTDAAIELAPRCCGCSLVLLMRLKEKAEAAGLEVVMDRCTAIEFARLFGGLNFGITPKLYHQASALGALLSSAPSLLLIQSPN